MEDCITEASTYSQNMNTLGNCINTPKQLIHFIKQNKENHCVQQ